MTVHFLGEQTQELNKSVNSLYIENMNQSLKSYRYWIDKILEFAKKENAEIIHILNGDVLYRCFGLYLKKLKDYKVIVTFHHMDFSFFKRISIKNIFRNINMDN